MEEPVHYMLMLIQLADGTYIQKLAEIFTEPMTLMQCLEYGAEKRAAASIYLSEENRHVMKDGSGDWFGYGCYQDPDKMN